MHSTTKATKIYHSTTWKPWVITCNLQYKPLLNRAQRLFNRAMRLLQLKRDQQEVNTWPSFITMGNLTSSMGFWSNVNNSEDGKRVQISDRKSSQRKDLVQQQFLHQLLNGVHCLFASRHQWNWSMIANLSPATFAWRKESMALIWNGHSREPSPYRYWTTRKVEKITAGNYHGFRERSTAKQNQWSDLWREFAS